MLTTILQARVGVLPAIDDEQRALGVVEAALPATPRPSGSALRLARPLQAPAFDDARSRSMPRPAIVTMGYCK